MDRLTGRHPGADDGPMEVRLATASDIPALSRTLGRAFDDDPVMAHLIPRHVRHHTERLARFMLLGTKGAVADGTVYTTAELSGGAVWRAPGRWKVPTRQLLPDTPALVRALGRRLLVGMATLQALERHHPTEPHWYLEILGTEPAEQGKGIGSALMAPVLERCDTEGMPAYLESSKERNVPYYERHGFRVTEELRLPKDGPPLWAMWRDPRPG
jgi:GNAT superfamily N-acetyltransferase